MTRTLYGKETVGLLSWLACWGRKDMPARDGGRGRGVKGGGDSGIKVVDNHVAEFEEPR